MRSVLGTLFLGAFTAMLAGTAVASPCVGCIPLSDNSPVLETFTNYGDTDEFVINGPGELFIWLNDSSSKFLVDVNGSDLRVHPPGGELVFKSSGTYDVFVTLKTSADPLGAFDFVLSPTEIPLDDLNLTNLPPPTVPSFGLTPNGFTPLPSTWGMLLGGLAGLGFLAHRGRKQAAAAA
jgi:hypothetical protein